MRHRPALFLLSTLLVVTLPVVAAERKVIAPPGSATGLPFSPGILSGGFLYLSGAMGNKPGSLEFTGDIEAQTRQTMENLGTVLKAAGMDFSRVVSTNVFLRDPRDFDAFNNIYRTYFPESPPARATVQADLAMPGSLLEVAMVAASPEIERTAVTPSGMKRPDLPYSWGILAGDTLFIAGATSRDPESYRPVPGATAAQTQQALENVGAVLKAAGMGYEDVVSCNVFLDDARDFRAMNEAYRSFFEKDPPARATVRAKLMNPSFRTEIQCVAVRGAGGQKKVIVAEGARRPSSPFSPALLVRDRLYLAGFVGRGPQGMAPGDVKAQTRQSLENLKATLEAAGMDLANVVQANVYLSDIRHYQAMNEVYRELISSPPPARATVGAQLMSPAALVEIMMVATK